MPKETNSASSPPADKEPKEPKARKAASKTSLRTEENKVEKTRGPESEQKSDHGTNAEDSAKSSGNGKPQEGKRPNRRRRGKGKAHGKEEDPAVEKDGDGSASVVSEKLEPKEMPAPNAQRPPQKPRGKVDPDKLAKKAWKIYLAEVSEEGVALIGDNDARELARRCFRLAEVFLEEEGRRS